MTYILNTPHDTETMLAAIGVKSLDELFEQIPKEARFNRELNIPPALGEQELMAHISALAAKNVSPAQRPCFLGGGAYDHFIPSVVDYIAGRGEFYTSYTPYQPEVSQGNLQAFFEYQTLITELTGMPISNASLYDGGSAAVEACLMAVHGTGRSGRVVTAASVHPEYRQIIETYFKNLGIELITVGAPDGTVNPEDIAAALTDDTAAVLIQQPNFFGSIEQVEEIGRIAKARGAAYIVSVDPISLGILKKPGEYGADIVVAEGQSLGTPLQYGGPYLGIMACQEAFVRRMPGRIVGQTVDRRGKRCWVLTLQTREQHIRREKATSNICTNQGLFALRASIYLATQGPQGLQETANLCLQKSHYALEQLTRGGQTQRGRLTAAFDRPFFKEFVVRDTAGDVPGLISAASNANYFAGIPLGRWYPELSDCFLVAVTEKRTKNEIDGLAKALQQSPKRQPALA